MSEDITESQIADEIISNEPRVREEIVAELQAKETASEPVTNDSYTPPEANPVANNFRSVVDDSPESFNPAIHETDENGRPVFNAKGGYRKKRGRKPGFKSSSNANTTNSNDAGSTNANGFKQSVSASNEPLPDYSATGKILAGLFFGITTGAIGPEWEPSVSENEQITAATIRYCEAMEISDIPPGFALLLCVGMYAVPRFAHENTRNKVSRVAEAIGLKKRKKTVPPDSVNPVDFPLAGNVSPTMRNGQPTTTIYKGL
jgi:hypothetical protein